VDHLMLTNGCHADPSFAYRTEAPLIRLSWRQFVVILAVAAALAMIIGMVLAPELQERHACHALKQFEREFGFESGTIVVSDSSGTYWECGITAVQPNGRFDRLGVRAGDIPFEYHGRGAVLLHYELQEASRGHGSEIDVWNMRDGVYSPTRLRHVVFSAKP
jgi:hypothetical protein